MATILHAAGVTKFFRHPWTLRPIPVLRNIHLEIAEGEIYGIIGRNGAGKTTMFKLLLGLVRPNRGMVTFAGKPLTLAARAAIGFLPEQPYFYDYLTVGETLHFYARLYGLAGMARRRRVAEVMEQVQLTAKATARLRTLSKGMLQRVGIGQAIINRPRLLILDEPMSGLDPEGRHSARTLIRSLHSEGTTIIFSSHILSDAEALCDRVAILSSGRICDIVALEHHRAPHALPRTVPDLDAIALHDSLEDRFLASTGYEASVD